jgi:hypothetical protein
MPLYKRGAICVEKGDIVQGQVRIQLTDQVIVCWRDQVIITNKLDAEAYVDMIATGKRKDIRIISPIIGEHRL